jgi:ketosteroid isomerase-like protein
MGDEVQIRNLLENWAKAIREEDMPGVLAHHADDIVMFDVQPLKLMGIDKYKEAWEIFFAAQGKGFFNLDKLEITASGEVAFCHSIVICGTNDENKFPVRLTVGLRKINGDWKVTHEHHSTVPN